MSLVPVLKNPETRIKDHIYHCFPKGRNPQRLGSAIRTSQYRLVAWTPVTGKGKVDDELYDYLNDPLETKNLASSRPELVKELANILEKHPEPIPQRKRN